ncbi:unnamed protein product [Parnassius mnemosyne]|uniref:Uncharacterized protein n=1 Tax=Parnassius mnemosyne TaxID=213953 RepID=A0AAV1M2I3_9NEOP
MDSISKRLKCSNCNIVICEVLAFVQNKLDVMDEQSLIQICESSFSAEEIELAKSLLFESVSKRPKIRKRQGKTLRNIEDIICLLKETDPEQVPIFVARRLEKLPPVTFDHVDVTVLLKKIVLLEKTIHGIQHQYVTKNQLHEEINEYFRLNSFANREQNIIYKRGDCDNFMYDSGPMALSTSCNNASYIAEANEPEKCKSLSNKSHQESMHSRHSSPIIISSVNEKSQPPASVLQSSRCANAIGDECKMIHSATRPFIPVVNETADGHVSKPFDALIDKDEQINDTLIARRKTFSEVVQRDGVWKEPKRSEEWIVVQKRRLRNRFISQKGTAVDLEGKSLKRESKENTEITENKDT